MIPQFFAACTMRRPVLPVLLLLFSAGCGKAVAPPLQPSPPAPQAQAQAQARPAATVTLVCVKTGNGFGDIDPPAAWPPGQRHAVEKGRSQTLTAISAPGSLFAGWSGDLPEGANAKDAAITVSMDRDREIKAEFSRELRTLDFRLDGKAEDWTLVPPPGKLMYPAGDTVLLYAAPRTPNTAPLWSGKTESVSKGLVRVCLTEDMTVTLGSQAGGDAGGTDAPSFALDPQKDAALNVPLRGGELSGWFSTPYTQGTPWGAGLSWIAHDKYPNTCPFRWVALNYEHVFNGAAADNLRAAETPRRDPLVLLPAMPDTVRAHWPAAQSSWDMDSDMAYTLTAPDAVDISFSVTPRKVCAPLGYVALMWASYLNFARDGRIHFWGEEAGQEGWCALGEPTGDSKLDLGSTVPFKGEATLPVEPQTLVINLTEHPTKRFLKPFYYGLTDGDQNFDTQDDTMVVIMMFDREAPIRLTRWNWTGNPHWPAWDWQFVIRDPQVDTTYRYRARMVYKPFVSPEDVMAEYDRWRAGLPPAP